MTKSAKVPVTERALVQRLNRKLREEGETLKAARGARAVQELGDYFIVNDRNAVTAQHIDIEKLGRELGALQAWEELAAE